MKNHPVTEGDLNTFLKAHPHIKVAGDFRGSIGNMGEIRKRVEVIYEEEEQAEVCRWLDQEHPDIKYFAVPNGARTSWSTAKKLKATGMKSGIPDLVFPNPRGGFHGYYQEMKRRKGGVVSDDQFIWIEFLRGQGYCVDVVKGADESKAGILAYHGLGPFSLVDWTPQQVEIKPFTKESFDQVIKKVKEGRT